jgi:hypothetical protein
MPDQREHLDVALPGCFSLEGLVYVLGAQVIALAPVEIAEGTPEAIFLAHAAISTKSFTESGEGATPIAMAGV